MATPKDIAGIVAMISAAYPNFNPTELTVEVYLKTLQDLPGEELQLAAMQCISENGRKFAPSVGELRGAVAEIRRRTANAPSSYEAWQEVQQQILENGGDYGRPVWSHALVEKTVRVIGWRNLRMSEEQVADRARFISAYEQFEARMLADEMLLPEVRGYIEANGGRLLAPADQIKLLADKWSVTK